MAIPVTAVKKTYALPFSVAKGSMHSAVISLIYNRSPNNAPIARGIRNGCKRNSSGFLSSGLNAHTLKNLLMIPSTDRMMQTIDAMMVT